MAYKKELINIGMATNQSDQAMATSAQHDKILNRIVRVFRSVSMPVNVMNVQMETGSADFASVTVPDEDFIIKTSKPPPPCPLFSQRAQSVFISLDPSASGGRMFGAFVAMGAERSRSLGRFCTSKASPFCAKALMSILHIILMFDSVQLAKCFASFRRRLAAPLAFIHICIISINMYFTSY